MGWTTKEGGADDWRVGADDRGVGEGGVGGRRPRAEDGGADTIIVNVPNEL